VVVSGDQMKKRETVSSMKKKAWKEFSKFVRLRDAIETTKTKTHAKCISCGKTYPAFGVGCLQAGHFIPGRRALNLFDERGCHAQCYHCNHHLTGNWPRYYDAMVKKYGKKVIEALKKQDKQNHTWSVSELTEIRDKYKVKLKEMT